jgi:peptide/nickel transport system permease protein
MSRFLIRRLVLAVATLWVVSLAVFVTSELLPGDVARHILGQSATPDNVAALQQQLGLNQPAPLRYLHWLAGFVTGQWGTSLALRVPLADLVPARLGNSLVLAALALLVTVPISVAAGVLSAMYQDRWIDRAISLIGLSAIAIPEFVSGVFLIVVFSLWLHVMPATATIPTGASPLSVLPNLWLPALSLAVVLFAYLARMTRSSTVQVLASDYVRTAVLKGLPTSQVILRHVLRNALLPTVTIIGAQLGWLVGGLVVVENLFGYPGLGGLLLFAALNKDIPLLETCVMIVAGVYLLANTAADLAYGWLNPRIRYG